MVDGKRGEPGYGKFGKGAHIGVMKSKDNLLCGCVDHNDRQAMPLDQQLNGWSLENLFINNVTHRQIKFELARD